MHYRYTQKWVDLFVAEPGMIRVETGHYIKSLHNLLNAHFDLRNHQQFDVVLKKFEAFAATERVLQNDNFLVQTFIYLTNAKINQHFMQGSFEKGLLLIPGIEQKLEEYDLYLDKHRIMVLNYKMALMHFGSKNYSTCIDYVHRIIHDTTIDLRYDLQCYARLLHLLAHYELGNFELMEPLTKAVYRFMSKRKNFTVVESEMFKFLRNSFQITRRELHAEFEKFLAKVKQFEKNRFETRAFAYLDIISWVESKVYNKTMSEVIHEKYLDSPQRHYKEAS